MSDPSYFDRIKAKVQALEEKLGRKLTLEEQDQVKAEAMRELWMENLKES